MKRSIPSLSVLLVTAPLALVPQTARADEEYRLVNIVNPPFTIKIGGDKCQGSVVVRDGSDFSEIGTLGAKNDSLKVDQKKICLEFKRVNLAKGYEFDLSFASEKGTTLSCHVESKPTNREAGLVITNEKWTGRPPKPRFNPAAKYVVKNGVGSGMYFLSIAF